jgi:hypothetical protein
MAKKDKEEVPTSTAMIVHQEDGTQIMVPEALKKYMNTGTEGLTKDDLQMPKLSLAQGLSPQLIPDKAEYIEGLKLGDAFNSATNKIYGRGPWEIVVICKYDARYVEFIPRSEGGGVKDPNVDPNDPRCQWGPNGEKPKATKYYDYIVSFVDTKETIALSLKSTGIKMAKKLNTLMAKRGPVPIFMGKYTLKAILVPGKNQSNYAAFQINNAGFITDEKHLMELAKSHDLWAKKKPQEVIDPDQPHDDVDDEDIAE